MLWMPCAVAWLVLSGVAWASSDPCSPQMLSWFPLPLCPGSLHRHFYLRIFIFKKSRMEFTESFLLPISRKAPSLGQRQPPSSQVYPKGKGSIWGRDFSQAPTTMSVSCGWWLPHSFYAIVPLKGSLCPPGAGGTFHPLLALLLPMDRLHSLTPAPSPGGIPTQPIRLRVSKSLKFIPWIFFPLPPPSLMRSSGLENMAASVPYCVISVGPTLKQRWLRFLCL